MAFCTKCGAELLDNAMFCTKCGARVDKVENYAPVQNDYIAPTQQPQPISDNQDSQISAPAPAESDGKKAKKQINISGVISNNFMPLYVILGVVSIVLLQFATLMSLSAFGFAVALVVFAILCAIAFCVVGSIKFFSADISQNNNKHTSGDIICFALGIIGLVYVLVTSIVVLVSAKNILDALEAFVAALGAL